MNVHLEGKKENSEREREREKERERGNRSDFCLAFWVKLVK